MFSLANGQHPITGVISGAASSVVSSGIGSAVHRGVGQLGAGGSAIMIVGGGLSGGIGARLSGGDFWVGATHGLMVSGLNHVAHGLMHGGPGDPPTKAELKEGLCTALECGEISIEVYERTMLYLDEGSWGIIKEVLWNNKGDIALSIFPGGRIVKGGTKLLNQFNSVESLLQNAGKFSRIKGGAQQAFIKGDGASIFKAISQGGTRQANGTILMKDGTTLFNHFSSKTGVYTIDINRASQVFKIRVTP